MCALITRTSNAAREHWAGPVTHVEPEVWSPDAMTIGAVSGLLSSFKGQRCAACHDARVSG